MKPVQNCKDFIDGALEWGGKGCWFEPYCWWSHCDVSLSKALYPMLKTCPDMIEILLTGV